MGLSAEILEWVYHALLQGIFDLGIKTVVLNLVHWQVVVYHAEY